MSHITSIIVPHSRSTYPFLQFLYGEDGMDAQRIERQVFDSYGFTASKFKEVFLLDTSSDKFGQLNYTVSSTNETAYYLRKNVVERCRNDMALRAMMEEEYEQLLKDRESLRYCQIGNLKSRE